jgi:hypothetical protein
VSPQTNSQGPAETRYELLKGDREQYLTRAREASRLTLPYLIPEEGSTAGRKFYTPYNSVASRGINMLAGKILLVVLPPNISFHRLVLEPKEQIELENLDDPEAEDNTAQEAIDDGFSKVERLIDNKINLWRPRPKLHVAMKHLIVGGNGLLYFGKRQTKFFSLNKYVVQRNADDEVIEIVVKEEISPDVIDSPKLRKAVEDALKQEAAKTNTPVRKTVNVFTHIMRGPSRWTSYQEVMGIRVPKSVGTYPLDACPWLALRWEIVDGENYGRGLVEQYIGDVATLEGLWMSLTDAAMAASKTLYGVIPGSTIKKKDLEKKSGSVIDGNLLTDVTVLAQDKKMSDFNFAAASADKVESRLSFVFLLNSAVQRDAERVTAEEIRFMANEIETALGGVYTTFSEELQLPLVRLALNELIAEGALDGSIKNGVQPVIVTGIDALGRNQEQMRMDTALNRVVNTLGPEIAASHLHPDEYIRRTFNNMGVDGKGLVKTKAQLQQQQQQAVASSLAEKAAAPVAKAMTEQPQE